MVDGMFLAAAILLGACVGSFLNVVIYRVPAGTFFAKGHRSACPRCGARIAWYDNLPVLSWLALRARARCCGARIAWRYPLVELTTAAAFGLLFALPPSGLTFTEANPSGTALLAFALHAWFVATLIACTFIDIDHRILPDVLTIPGMVVGCIGALLVPGLAGVFAEPGLQPAVGSLLYSLAGLGVGFGVTWLVRVSAQWLFRKEAMGFGDVKFMGAIGAFLGPSNVLLAFLLACVLGAVGGVAHRLATGDAYVPFGPFLAGGAVLALFANRPLNEFLFITWPEWQRREASSPWVLLSVAVVCVVLLFVLIRRGRGP